MSAELILDAHALRSAAELLTSDEALQIRSTNAGLAVKVIKAPDVPDVVADAIRDRRGAPRPAAAPPRDERAVLEAARDLARSPAVAAAAKPSNYNLE